MRFYRLCRNKVQIVLSIVLFILCIKCKLCPSKINNFSDVINGILSFASLGTAFLFSSFTLIPSLPDLPLIKILKRKKTDKKLLDRLLITIVTFVFSAIFALLILSFYTGRTSSILSVYIFSFFISLFFFGVLNLVTVLFILLKFVNSL